MNTPSRPLRYVTAARGETVFAAATRVFGPGAQVDIFSRVEDARPIGAVSTTASGPAFRVYPASVKVPS